jgi:hypothetical protein
MTTIDITPSSSPSRRRLRWVTTGRSSARYLEQEQKPKRYSVHIARPAPRELRIAVHFGKESDGVWAHIDELDVAAEGKDVNEAFRNLVSSAREWLLYLREESPDLAPELKDQTRYAPLLDAPVFSWFRDFRFDD